MKVLNVRIELGNDAMRTGSDVREALQNMANKIYDLRMIEDLVSDDVLDAGKIKDVNGNTVGYFTLQIEGE